MTIARCKFAVTANLPTYPTSDADSPFRRLSFDSRYDQDLPEDVRFQRATPVGRLDVVTDNKTLAELKIGDEVYIDITKIV